MTDEMPTRLTPQSELDFNKMMTDPVWGSSEINQDLKSKLTRMYGELDKDGKESVTQKSLWSFLAIYTRDLRLSNLNREEMCVVTYFLNLAGYFILCDMNRAAMYAMIPAITILDTAQSKNGFLRRQMHTFRHEQFKQEEPVKKSLFGMGKGGQD